MRLRLTAPRVDDLFAAPELAVLEATVDVTLIALVAADPDDDGLDRDEPTPPERRASRALADAARNVAAAINRYRLALLLADERERRHLPPF